MNDDGALVVSARCTADGCEWGPFGAANPTRWRIVEHHRFDHETETDHTTTVETVRQRTILDGTPMVDATLDIAEEQLTRVEWVCPECGRTAADLDATRRYPDCGEPFREALP